MKLDILPKARPRLKVVYRNSEMAEKSVQRFTGVDPLADQFGAWNPYHYVHNNPLLLVDPTGMAPEYIIVGENDDGTYKIIDGKRDGDKGIYLDDGKGGKGKKIGETTTEYSFFLEDDSVVKGAIIDFGSFDGQNFIDRIIADNPGLYEYMSNAKGGEPLDYKTNGINERSKGISEQQYKHRGSVLADGSVASARDVGNIVAGIVSGRNGLSWAQSRFGFDALETWQNRSWSNLKRGPLIEGAVSRSAQYRGFEQGVMLRRKDKMNKKNKYFPPITRFRL